MTSFVGLALAQDDIVTKRVQFMRGSSSATVKGLSKDVKRAIMSLEQKQARR